MNIYLIKWYDDKKLVSYTKEITASDKVQAIKKLGKRKLNSILSIYLKLN